MPSLLKNLPGRLRRFGPLYILRAAWGKIFTFNQPLNRLKFQFFNWLHNLSYRRLTSLARRLSSGSHPKQRLLDYHRFFLNHITSDDSVLDIGCGQGDTAALLALKAKRVVGLDLNNKNISLARAKYSRPNLSFLVADATTYPFQEKFDKIILSNVLEHIKERVAFLKKLSRLSDTLLLRVPLLTRDWLTVYKKELGLEYRLDPTHFIEYTEAELASELDAAGWSITSAHICFGEFWGTIKIKKP